MTHTMTIETASLRLRKFTLEDMEDLYALTKQKEITDILPDWKVTWEQLNEFLRFVISSYDNYNADDVRILLAIEHKVERKLIGWCGVFPNDMLAPEDRELAYAVSKDYRNCGYTTEAALGLLSYVFQTTRLQQIVAIVKPFNVASRRVAEKAGFTQQRLVTLSDQMAYDYFTIERESFMIKEIKLSQIEPYLDLLAEIEHTQLNRNNPNHELWLQNRMRTLHARGAVFYVYEDAGYKDHSGIVTLLHDLAPDGIEALGARAEIMQIGVARQSRRSGIGSFLLRHAEQAARARGVYCLFMMTYAEDYDVIAFYGKNGFVPVATLPDVYGPGLEGNVFLRKVLR